MAFSGSVVTVGTTATAIGVAAIGGELWVTNTGAATVYLGGPTVTASGANQGYPLATNASLTVPKSGTQDATLYGIVATGTNTVAVLATTSTE